ncbi:hypothetical protein C8J57DRAFT_1729499 [Mycena rebaudengoi]|nr:hypothetical protein C8J57DRAFT_1729499 [Mycena rebaudengoi]
MPSFYLSTPHHDVVFFSLHSLASLAIHGRFPPSTFFVLQSPTLTPFSTEPSPSPSPPAAWAFPSPPRAALPDEGSSYASHSAHPSSSSHHSHASYRESVWVALSRRRRRSGGATVLLGIRLGLDDALHFPAIRRHRGPAPKLLILLRRHAERRALLPRPAPLVPSRPSVPAACTVGGVLVLDIGALRVLRRVPRAAGLCARGQPADDGKRAEDKLVDDAGGMMRAEVLYLRAPSPAELRTFHCEKMRKMPLSGLDPSMLIGFACRGGVGWVDLRRRIALDEPLTSLSADDDDDMGLESVWDPEEEAVDADDGEGSMRFFDEGPPSASHGVSSSASHAHASTYYHSNSNSTTSCARMRSEEANDAEEDPGAPHQEKTSFPNLELIWFPFLPHLDDTTSSVTAISVYNTIPQAAWRPPRPSSVVTFTLFTMCRSAVAKHPALLSRPHTCQRTLARRKYDLRPSCFLSDVAA